MGARAAVRRLAAVAGLVLAAGAGAAEPPSYDAVRAAWRPSEARLLDRHGEVLAERRLDSTVRRLDWVALADLSPSMQQALLAAEDRRFFEHGGVDWRSLAGAAWENLGRRLAGRRARGASTLTMQLAGFLDPALRPRGGDRSLTQKWDQLQAARAIEAHWSKPQILEAYLNLANFRGELSGIGAAALGLFGKRASGLDLGESLLLAALLPEPAAPPPRIARRACAVAATLPAGEAPSCADLEALAARTLAGPYAFPPREDLAPHLAAHLLTRPGVAVRTTVDARLQRQAVAGLRERLLELAGRGVADGAVIVIDNATGEVLAWVGSSGDLSESPAVDGLLARRQAGSTLKPFLYGAAIDGRLLTAASLLDDAPINLPTPTGLYVPENYDHDFKGPVSVRTALAASLNVPAVRTLGLVGADAFVQRLRRFGLDSVAGDGDFYGFGLALGAAEVRLADLANAYRALANGGVLTPLKVVPDSRDLGREAPGRRALGREAAFVVTDILADRGARAATFGLDNPLATRVWTAVKTGTSKDMRDNWCVGFSRRYTVGVWVGNFGGEPMRDVSGISGAAPLWRDLIEFLHAEVASRPPAPPSGVVAGPVRFIPDVESPRSEWFITGTATTEVRLVAAGTDAGGLPRIGTPATGTIVMLDPDIPASHQRLRLTARGGVPAGWRIDGEAAAGAVPHAWWTPEHGRHRVALVDADGREIDAAEFEVRGGGATANADAAR